MTDENIIVYKADNSLYKYITRICCKLCVPTEWKGYIRFI